MDFKSKPQLATSLRLARAFGHGWATCQFRPTWVELVKGINHAVAAWEARLAAADKEAHRDWIAWAETYLREAEAAGDEAEVPHAREYVRYTRENASSDWQKWRGLTPSACHVSASGTVSWEVSPSGDAKVTVRAAREGGGRTMWVGRYRYQAKRLVVEYAAAGASAHEEDCIARVRKHLGGEEAAEIIPPPTKPLVTPGKVRRL